MLSINTNLSSLIAQSSMKTSTDKLNQAIERMTTGLKINHASDNAANYSISTNLTTKISGYQIAEENTAMAMDMVTTAESILDEINDKVQRVRFLQEQAINGTYGEESLKAINSEVNSLVDEINRLYSTAEYNGIKLFTTPSSPTQAISGYSLARTTDSSTGFIKEIAQRDTSSMTKLSSIDPAVAISSGTYSISTEEELAQLATMTNNQLITGGEFVLANDIDLSGYSNWTMIGGDNGFFQGSFDGNGFVVSNLTMSAGALFGTITNATIKNLGVENVIITSGDGAGIILIAQNSLLDNCYATGSIEGGNLAAGILGLTFNYVDVQNCWSDVDVSAAEYAGGIVGFTYSGSVNINNCFAKGDVYGNAIAGGIIAMQGSFDNDGSQVGNITRVTNSSFLGKIDGTGINAAILSCNDDIYSDSVSNCYYNAALNPSVSALEIYNTSYTNNAPADAVIGKTTAELEAMLPTLYKYTSNTSPVLPNLPNNSGSNISALIGFQIGINGSSTSQISLDISFMLENLEQLRNIGLDNNNYFETIDSILNTISSKQTEYGAVMNRLESALEEISTQYENLVSSRSTIRDADIAKESASYIQAQILQQASATLMATANQSPAIALQLI